LSSQSSHSVVCFGKVEEKDEKAEETDIGAEDGGDADGTEDEIEDDPEVPSS
jgi:hypothetical protein